MKSSVVEDLDDSSHSSQIAAIADEFSERISKGESPDIEEFARRLPGYEEVVRDVLKSMQLMQDLREDIDPNKNRAHLVMNSPLLLGDIGEYEIISEIGRGGMGVVYRARQKSLSRIVALKVLPFAASLDPKKLKRFQVETQSASMIQHPNVVAIFGTGCHQGVHYYAMQYIDGLPLDEYIFTLRIQKRRLSFGSSTDAHSSRKNEELSTDYTREDITQSDDLRNPLFRKSHAQVPNMNEPRTPFLESLSFRKVAEWMRDCANALENAHELGVIHRDIKPSNLLVDRSNKIWITDFGLAHMESSGTLTATGDLLGTLRYMSPEQARGGHAHIDRRSDIYSLGATMYELLTLEPMLQSRDRAALLRQLTLEEPRAPRKVNPSIPRDLETIVLKATCKEPKHRYETAAEFAKDLDRFLEDLPVLARRPGIVQILTKLARRHKTAAWTLATLPFLLAFGLILSNIEITRQKVRAEQALEIAKKETVKARAVSDMMQQLVGAANPDRTKGNDYTVRQLLDDLSANLFEQLTDQPEVESALRSTIGNSYRRLGAPEKARPHLTRALELKQQERSTSPLHLAEGMEDLAWNEAALGRYESAISLAKEAVDIHENIQETSRSTVHALWCLQHCLIYGNNFEESDATAKKAIELAHSITPRPPETANILHNLSQSKNLQNDFEEAERLARQAVELHAELHGATHPETGWGLDALARSLQSQEKYAEAEEAFQRALKIFRTNYASDHKSVRMTMELLQSVLSKSGNIAAAEHIDQTRFAESIRNVLLATGNPGSTLLDLLGEHEQYLAAGELVMSGQEVFQTTEQCLKAVEVLNEYAYRVKARFGSDNDPRAKQRWITSVAALLNRAADNCPENDNLLNSVAWNMVCGPEVNAHQPRRAIDLAKRAISISNRPGAIWNTLGLAYLRTNDNSNAIAALERSRTFPETDEHDLVFLAIATHRIGNELEAIQYLNEARTQYATRKKPIPDLERYIEEAKDVLASDPKLQN